MEVASEEVGGDENDDNQENRPLDNPAFLYRESMVVSR